MHSSRSVFRGAGLGGPLTSLAFFGLMRLGEPLCARQRDLVLPEEAGLAGKVCFLRVGRPKPGRRGRGRVQHARISDAATVDLVKVAFGDLDADDLLYPCSAGAYRRRWDALLSALGVGRETKITPGGLRVEVQRTSITSPPQFKIYNG